MKRLTNFKECKEFVIDFHSIITPAIKLGLMIEKKIDKKEENKMISEVIKKNKGDI